MQISLDKNASRLLFPILVGGGLIALLLILFLFLLARAPGSQPAEPALLPPSQEKEKTGEPQQDGIVERQPVEISPPGERKETYLVYAGKPQNPQILQVDFDPFDIKTGEEQMITVQTRSKGDTISNATGVTVQMITENGSETIALELKKVEEPDLTIIWQGSWMPEDTNVLHGAIIAATSETGESSIELSFPVKNAENQ